MNNEKAAPRALTIVGPGRVGQSIAGAAASAGVEVEVLGREFEPDSLHGKTVLLCVPDVAIVPVAERIAGSNGLPEFAGHTSGATTLGPLAACQTGGAFSLHPLQTVPTGSTDLVDCPAACTGSTARSSAVAEGLAAALGMRPFELAETDRAIYHAAASIASNFLVSLEQTAAELLGGIGIENPREVLAPLVQRSLTNWEQQGASALTGPIARGDESTVEMHRQALAGSRPELLPLYDTLAERTRAISAGTRADG